MTTLLNDRVSDMGGNQKMRFMVICFVAMMLLVGITGCGNSAAPADNTTDQASTEAVVEPAPEANSEAESAAEEDAAEESAAELPPLALDPNVDVETVASVLDRDDVFLLDVREQHEYDAGHIAGNTLIPIGTVAERLAEIPTDKEVIVYCHSGARSARVTQFLTEQGYTNIHNMLGGIVAWQSAGYAVE